MKQFLLLQLHHLMLTQHHQLLWLHQWKLELLSLKLFLHQQPQIKQSSNLPKPCLLLLKHQLPFDQQLFSLQVQLFLQHPRLLQELQLRHLTLFMHHSRLYLLYQVISQHHLLWFQLHQLLLMLICKLFWFRPLCLRQLQHQPQLFLLQLLHLQQLFPFPLQLLPQIQYNYTAQA